ncbi:MAG: ATP-binding cassette domain-containing protein [Verrucomicrobiales bacterium]|nr:ATP-binding cassette domain-containing protein [Verrucomicrobiales bacterium]
MKKGLSISDLCFLDWGPLSFSVNPAECVGLRGASGSGKTLLLRAIADLDEHSGTISLDETPCNSLSGPDWRRRVAMLPAESSWWRDTVGEHFPEELEESRLLVEQLGFDSGKVFDWEISRLSVGERQRLALVRLLQHKPRVLLLDEPTANLDEKSTELVEQVISKYRSNESVPVLWVTHSREQLERVSSRSLILENKKLSEEVAG